MNTVGELLDILNLKSIEHNIYQGHSKTIGSPIVFGGQVLAQSLNAAYRSVSPDRFLHSVHAYFLSAGHLDSEIRFEVSTIRDGKSFSVRRVTVFQGQRAIMILAASFHIHEEGFEHQIDVAKDITQPEDLMNWNDLLFKYESVLSQEAKFFLKMPRPIEFRPMFYDIPGNGESLPPINHVWFKLKNDFKSSSLALKQQVLTYISDYNILITAMHPHTDTNHWSDFMSASLDHSIWFFRDFDFNDWMLFSIDSPSSQNARGFSRGNIFTKDGVLIASVAQEGLMRPIKR